MKILIVGGGGREHAICWALAKSPKVTKIYCAPGNAGTLKLAQNIDIPTTDFKELIAFAKNVGIDLTICPMDEPLVKGIVDEFTKAGLSIFGPNKSAAHIEGSKAFSCDFMIKYNIPTYGRAVCDNLESAMVHCANSKFPLWIKADGLAAGKGALSCQNMEVADRTLEKIFKEKIFGDSGNKVVIEEHVEGFECSVLAFCDGENIIPMLPAMDYKSIGEGNYGLNTGGMGSIVPNPHYTQEIANRCMQEIFIPTIRGMKQENREFVGIMFFGLMLTADGPKVIEYNCRPGDPETQSILPMLETDLLDIIQACMNKSLDKIQIKWKNNAVCCVVVASGGYPEAYKTGHPIIGLSQGSANIRLFHSGTKKDPQSENILTNGGRVISIVAEGGDIDEARQRAYDAVSVIRFRDMYYRKDIGDLSDKPINVDFQASKYKYSKPK